MDEFLENLKSGDIVLQGQWQFELKSEFSPKEGFNHFAQEFYFFIPNALQINQETYSKEEFYKDLTHYIRYKTPALNLKALASKFVLKHFTSKDAGEVIYEFKLLGNTYRSVLRDEIASLLSAPILDQEKVTALISEIDQIRVKMSHLKTSLFDHYRDSAISTSFRYVDEYVSNTTEHLMTGMLSELRKKGITDALDHQLTQFILEEMGRSPFYEKGMKDDEILYRKGLLKKFVMDALTLSVIRRSTQARLNSIISGFSAGIAMFVYLLLVAFYGETFVISSLPFIILTVAAYILKDRLKEGLKALSYRHALKFFFDYSTEILTPDENEKLGTLYESMAYISEEQVPQEIIRVRNREFHTMLPTFKRPEQIIYYKTSVELNPFHRYTKKVFSGINVILRLNCKEFMDKGSDPYHLYIVMDPKNLHVQTLHLPKVYHINLILKNSWTDEKKKSYSTLKKFRFIIDKNGIKKIEHVSSIHQ